jgi:imidazoleglycerol-phosphate dehydratase
MPVRKAAVERKTKETGITVSLVLDGEGECRVRTGIPFLNHMLEAWATHGRFDLDVKASGDLAVDPHHLVEDLGIVLGIAVKKAVGDGKGIARFGFAAIPMDEALAQVAVDCGGRGFLAYSAPLSLPETGGIPSDLFEHFFASVAVHGGITLHVTCTGRSDHHRIEAIYKAFGRALSQAVAMDPRVRGVPSTKGSF